MWLSDIQQTPEINDFGTILPLMTRMLGLGVVGANDL
jgi:hypothetical protein